MDLRLIFFSSYETVLSVIFGLVTVVISYKLFTAFMLKEDADDDLNKGNTAVAILAGVMTISVLILVQSSILPAVNTLQTMALGGEKITAVKVFISLGYFLLFYAISLVISIAIMFASVNIYMFLTTKVEEMQEIRGNNIAISIMLSCVIIGMTLFIQPSVSRFIGSLVNYEMHEKKPKVRKTGDGKVIVDPPPRLKMPEIK